MKVAFIDDICHQKTNSTSFLVEVLQQKFRVKHFWGNGFKKFNISELDEINKYSPDVLLFFQRIPNFFILKKFECKKIVFVPMFDQEIYYSKLEKLLLKTSLFLSRTKFDIKVLCFSEAISEYYKSFNCLIVKYYPKPIKTKNLKPKVYFWQRENGISILDVAEIAKDFPLKIKQRNVWLPKKEADLLSKNCGIAIAPRYSEGIGMGFLELMAKGICVIAYNMPTHNEYIIDGWNGFLFDDCLEINLSNWKLIGENAYASCVRGYDLWNLDKQKILDFIQLEGVVI